MVLISEPYEEMSGGARITSGLWLVVRRSFPLEAGPSFWRTWRPHAHHFSLSYRLGWLATTVARKHPTRGAVFSRRTAGNQPYPPPADPPQTGPLLSPRPVLSSLFFLSTPSPEQIQDPWSMRIQGFSPAGMGAAIAGLDSPAVAASPAAN
jgi:hypothetical protein